MEGDQGHLQNAIKHIKDLKAKDRFRKAQIRQSQYRREASHLREREPEAPRQAIVADEGEHLLQYGQETFRPELSLVNAKKAYSLELAFGRYVMDFSKEGNRLAMASDRGHVSVLQWKRKELISEFHVKEAVRDVKFMQGDFVALAQSSVVHIYDRAGLEVHRVESLREPKALEFLPHHYLLASLSAFGRLSYLDVSRGQLVAEIKTQLRDATMRLNPHNSIVGVAGEKGSVAFYSPASGEALMKVLAHNAVVRDLAFSLDGRLLVTAGDDRSIKVFDLRNTCKELQSYYTDFPVRKIDLSQRGVLAVSQGNSLTFWSDFADSKQKRPYLRHKLADNSRTVTDLQFCPYEDFLGMTGPGFFESIVVPGTGFAHFDSFADDVAANKTQARQNEVRKLLEKLPFESIVLDPSTVGKADSASKEVLEAEKKAEKAAALAEEKAKQRKKDKRKKHIQKEHAASNIRREEVAKNNIARKQLYAAEKAKLIAETEQVRAVDRFLENVFLEK